jgi:endonuclease YncB( thermonuclease family)
MYEYTATVVRVVDGDTVVVSIDLGFKIKIEHTLRLYGLNAPELPTPEGKAAAEALRQKLNCADVLIRTRKDAQEKYGRYLATIFRVPRNINEEMVHEGYAIMYLP